MDSIDKKKTQRKEQAVKVHRKTKIVMFYLLPVPV